MKRLPLALTVTLAMAWAGPAAAERYTAKQDGDVTQLADATDQMHVSVVWAMSNAWRIQVKGRDPAEHSPRRLVGRKLLGQDQGVLG